MIPTVETVPDQGVELTRLLVVSDLGRSREWYQQVLGATVDRDYAGSSCVLRLLGSWLLLVTGGGPTDDKPTVTFVPPDDVDRVSSELIFRVPDCRGSYRVLRHRGAQFLTPPVDHGHEIRAFFRIRTVTCSRSAKYPANLSATELGFRPGVGPRRSLAYFLEVIGPTTRRAALTLCISPGQVEPTARGSVTGDLAARQGLSAGHFLVCQTQPTLDHLAAGAGHRQHIREELLQTDAIPLADQLDEASPGLGLTVVAQLDRKSSAAR
jgi:catechol 2,3-dioxygenase-like lactoylglutathione lyase family enzyme